MGLSNKAQQTTNTISLKGELLTDIEQGRFVKATASGVSYAGPSDKAVGVVASDHLEPSPYPSGRVYGIPISYGMVMVDAAGTFAIGDDIASDSDGKAVKATSGQIIKGVAQTAGSDGNKAIVMVLGNSTAVSTAIEGGLNIQGTWDADSNDPDISAVAETGNFWIVSTAGITDIGGITDWEIGDWVVKTVSGWAKVDNTDQVVSVNGEKGTVVLNQDDVADGSTYVQTHNDYTDAEKTKLSGVSENADVSGKITYTTKTANYTLTLSDFNKGVEFNSASNLTLTIPTNTAVAFEVGTVIPIARLGVGTVTITGASGVTVNSKDGALDIAGQYGEAVLRKVDTDTWILSGSLE